MIELSRNNERGAHPIGVVIASGSEPGFASIDR
jgi:hypothetical protein